MPFKSAQQSLISCLWHLPVLPVFSGQLFINLSREARKHPNSIFTFLSPLLDVPSWPYLPLYILSLNLTMCMFPSLKCLLLQKLSSTTTNVS